MSTVGERLREERLRLGLSQAELGTAAGVQKQAQLKYEKGERAPDTSYLVAIADAGADVQYIVTGVRQGQGIGESAVHRAVLDAVELLSLEKKIDADQLARAVTKLAVRSAPQSSGSPQDAVPRAKKIVQVSAPGGRAAGRNMTNVTIRSRGEDQDGQGQADQRAGRKRGRT